MLILEGGHWIIYLKNVKSGSKYRLLRVARERMWVKKAFRHNVDRRLWYIGLVSTGEWISGWLSGSCSVLSGEL